MGFSVCLAMKEATILTVFLAKVNLPLCWSQFWVWFGYLWDKEVGERWVGDGGAECDPCDPWFLFRVLTANLKHGHPVGMSVSDRWLKGGGVPGVKRERGGKA
jgi:hypothetical protein